MKIEISSKGIMQNNKSIIISMWKSASIIIINNENNQ
jgi:hypothetical protein